MAFKSIWEIPKNQINWLCGCLFLTKKYLSAFDGGISSQFTFYPDNHETFNQCWVGVGPSSIALVQHRFSIELKASACWEIYDSSFADCFEFLIMICHTFTDSSVHACGGGGGAGFFRVSEQVVGLLKWNESGFRPPLCTYRLNWARRTSWGWWDDWDDTVLQTQDSKFEPWRSEAEHATSRSRRLPTILTFTRGWGRNNCFFQTAETGNRTPDSGVKGSGANHYPRAPAQ